MPDLALALLAFAPPGDSGIWLDAPPKPGTVVTRPIDVTGETQALEGVLKVELFVVRGRSVRLVETYRPELPVGTIPFELRFDPAGMRPGRVTIRVVATTLAREFSAEATGLVVPRAAPRRAAPAAADTARPAVRAVPVVAVRRPGPASVAARPRLDDSGRAFGRTAPVLPYAPRPVRATPPRPVTRAAATPPEPLPLDRSGWASVAGGLLLLVTCSHLHRVLRTQPDERDAR